MAQPHLRRRERGAILVEAILVFGLLITLFLGLFDLFALSTAYMNFSQTAREGVLQATQNGYFSGVHAAATCTGVPQVDLQKVDSEYEDCRSSGSVPDPTTCGHYLVQWRIMRTLESLRSTTVSDDSIGVSSTCTTVSGAPSQLEIAVTGTFKGISPFFRNSPIAVRQLGLIR